MSVPVSAQAWAVQASTGWLNFGPLVHEGAWHARLGNMGNDIYFGMSLERSLGSREALYLSLIVAPTTMSVWPRAESDDELNRFSYRPFPGTANLTSERDLYTLARLRSGPVAWSCGSAGVSTRAGVFRGAAGLAVCGMSGLDPALWGRSGMRLAPGGEAELGFRLPVTASFQLGASCNATALLNHRGFVRMREDDSVAGLLAADAVVELPRFEPRRIALPLRCGLGAGVTL